MLYRLEHARDRRNALGDTSAVSTNANTTCQKYCYHQLAERVRELEKEVVPDHRLYQMPPAYSPFSAMTPCSNVSGGGFQNYSRPKNFPANLLSPNSPVPTQRFGLSSKIRERAHQIPERFDIINSLIYCSFLSRFWIDWQQKQMQNRIEELEYIKNKRTSSHDVDLTTKNPRESLLSHHDIKHRISLPRSTTHDRIVSMSIDNETSSSSTDDHSSFSFDQRSDDGTDTADLNDWNTSSPIEPINSISSVRKSHSTLDRSRLNIYLPFSYTNLPKQPMSTNNHSQSVAKPTTNIIDDLVETKSSASSIEDIAQIDTELNLTLLVRENQDQTNPLLYSKAIMSRTIEFRSLSKKNFINLSK